MTSTLNPLNAYQKLQSGDHRRRPSMEFKHQTKREAQVQLSHELDRLLHTCPPHLKEITLKEFEGFEKLFAHFISGFEPAIEWDKIQKLKDGTIRNYQELPPIKEASAKSLLDRLVVVKLNGGLGTSMGCKGPKSTIPVRSDLTFLDLTVQQIKHLNQKYGSDVPLVLMNSFNTDEDTLKVIRKYQGVQVRVHTFKQSRYPRINKESLMPLARTCADQDSEQESWYPPGHGDFYNSFHNSGLLDEFLSQGKEYVFISNIDNLGATVDLSILNFLLGREKGQCPFLMEVTDKTRADVKGGTLIRYEDELRLLEIAQVPKDHVDEFKSVKKFKIFNTNNLWIKLSAVREVVTEGGLEMEVIVNNKTLDSGLGVTQLEQAVGAAIRSFHGAMGLNVPRSRFLPVKKTDDLLLVMSNLYRLQQGTLIMSPQRQFDTTPLVKLGTSHFGKVKDFLKRFGTIPDMLELDHLSVSGDVTLGRGVILKGTVIIIANHGDRIDIPAGSILENKIVSGNMRILDH